MAISPRHVPQRNGANHGDLLWKVIARYDGYINGTNTKTALVTAFNAFVVSAVVLKWAEIVAQFSVPIMGRIAGALLALATLASLVSLWFAFRAVAPYLASPKAPQKYHSILFFEHVAEHEGGMDYEKAVRGYDDPAIEAELATQAHALAWGLHAKFHALKVAIRAIMWVQLPAFAAIVLAKLFELLFIGV
jgi:hypothetical protein